MFRKIQWVVLGLVVLAQPVWAEEGGDGGPTSLPMLQKQCQMLVSNTRQAYDQARALSTGGGMEKNAILHLRDMLHDAQDLWNVTRKSGSTLDDIRESFDLLYDGHQLVKAGYPFLHAYTKRRLYFDRMDRSVGSVRFYYCQLWGQSPELPDVCWAYGGFPD